MVKLSDSFLVIWRLLSSSPHFVEGLGYSIFLFYLLFLRNLYISCSVSSIFLFAWKCSFCIGIREVGEVFWNPHFSFPLLQENGGIYRLFFVFFMGQEVDREVAKCQLFLQSHQDLFCPRRAVEEVPYLVLFTKSIYF